MIISICIKIVAGFCLLVYSLIYVMSLSGRIINEVNPKSTKWIASLAFLPVIFISLITMFGVR